jgi:hypothetical protein
MTNDMHARAEMLIARERVEGIPAGEQEWLVRHLGECSRCAAYAEAMGRAIGSLRMMSVSVPRDLAARTRFRVRLRAQELLAREPRWRLIWAMCGASWVAGAATAPFIWRGLEWIGHRSGLPDFVWKMGFGVWWALPAIIAGAILVMEGGDRKWRVPGGFSR